MKKVALMFLPMMLLQSCFGDQDPWSQPIETYHYYYNNLMEYYDLQWEVDDAVTVYGHSYGTSVQTIVEMNESEQEVLIRTRSEESGQLIDSLSHTMYQYVSYMIAILGRQEAPHLICEQMDTREPSAGKVKFRFLHASEAMGPVDIYIGGDQGEDLALAGVDFTQASEYLETEEEQIWTAVVVSPANVLPADSVILDYRINNVFRTGRTYLCILEHINSSEESDFQMQVYDQPVYVYY